jgi:hypothetical protein
MKSQTILILAFLGLLLGLALLPQHGAQAKTCYDSSKNPIPCPLSNYLMTQQAKKAADLAATPVPHTVTPTQAPPPTPTDTPIPPASDTLQASALVAQPVPSACPNPAAGVASGPGIAPSGKPIGSSLFPWILGGGGLLGGILIGLLVPAVLKQFAGLRSDTKVTIYEDALIDEYTYPELSLKDHDRLKEQITDRPEKHTIN